MTAPSGFEFPRLGVSFANRDWGQTPGGVRDSIVEAAFRLDKAFRLVESFSDPSESRDSKVAALASNASLLVHWIEDIYSFLDRILPGLSVPISGKARLPQPPLPDQDARQVPIPVRITDIIPKDTRVAQSPGFATPRSPKHFVGSPVSVGQLTTPHSPFSPHSPRSPFGRGLSPRSPHHRRKMGYTSRMSFMPTIANTVIREMRSPSPPPPVEKEPRFGPPVSEVAKWRHHLLQTLIDQPSHEARIDEITIDKDILCLQNESIDLGEISSLTTAVEDSLQLLHTDLDPFAAQQREFETLLAHGKTLLKSANQGMDVLERDFTQTNEQTMEETCAILAELKSKLSEDITDLSRIIESDLDRSTEEIANLHVDSLSERVALLFRDSTHLKRDIEAEMTNSAKFAREFAGSLEKAATQANRRVREAVRETKALMASARSTLRDTTTQTSELLGNFQCRFGGSVEQSRAKVEDKIRQTSELFIRLGAQKKRYEDYFKSERAAQRVISTVDESVVTSHSEMHEYPGTLEKLDQSGNALYEDLVMLDREVGHLEAEYDRRLRKHKSKWDSAVCSVKTDCQYVDEVVKRLSGEWQPISSERIEKLEEKVKDEAIERNTALKEIREAASIHSNELRRLEFETAFVSSSMPQSIIHGVHSSRPTSAGPI